MPNDNEADGRIPDDAPKGPPMPATPPAVAASIDAFEAAVRLWWGDQDDAGKAAKAGAALTEMLIAKGQPYVESIPFAVRAHFARLQRQHGTVIQSAVSAAVARLIPATVQATPLSHLPTVTKTETGDQDGGD